MNRITQWLHSEEVEESAKELFEFLYQIGEGCLTLVVHEPHRNCCVSVVALFRTLQEPLTPPLF